MSFSLVGVVVNIVVQIMTTLGLPGLFALMVVESFGIPPVPSEVILPFSGFLVVEGTFSLEGALVAALGGALVGSFAAYAVGRWGRHRLVDLGIGPLKLEERHLDRMDRFFARRGEFTVAVARLIPIVRSYISYPAGTAKMNPAKFGGYTLAGSIPFTLAFVYAGMQLGSHWGTVSQELEWVNYVAAVVVVGAAIYLLLLFWGKLTPGWPPRWASRSPGAEPAESASAPPKIS